MTKAEKEVPEEKVVVAHDEVAEVDPRISGAGAAPMEISKAMQDMERENEQKKELEHINKIRTVADEVHDIILREELTSNDWAEIQRAISQDIAGITLSLKISDIYGLHRDTTNGGGEGEEEKGEPSSDGKVEEASE